jgi:GNAT superfamily N-acetyltransferase
MKTLVKELSCVDRLTIEAHFLALPSADRRLRFGGSLNDDAVRSYVEAIDFDRDAVFGVLDDELQLIAAAHLARDEQHAEIGISVLPEDREQGIGDSLLRRCHLHARNWGIGKLYMHCLTENSSMMHWARKNSMDIVDASGEADAFLALAPPNPVTFMSEVFEQRIALADYMLKSHLYRVRRVAFTLAAASPLDCSWCPGDSQSM